MATYKPQVNYDGQHSAGFFIPSLKNLKLRN